MLPYGIVHCFCFRWTNTSFRGPLLLCSVINVVGNLLYGLVSVSTRQPYRFTRLFLLVGHTAPQLAFHFFALLFLLLTLALLLVLLLLLPLLLLLLPLPLLQPLLLLLLLLLVLLLTFMVFVSGY